MTMDLGAWLLLLSTLLAGAVLLGVLARRANVPLTVVLALVGFLAGWLGNLQSPIGGERFEEVLVFVFLPVLVFEAALGLSTRAFFRNLVPILVLAIPALAVSAICVGLSLYIGLDTPLIPALLFGALISATDPVAVVAIFRELGVPRRLLTLVEGESLLNDGVAIVLFTILLAAALGGDLNAFEGVWEFIVVCFGGVAIGAGVGFLAALALPWLDRLSAAALSLAVAYGGFVLADDVLGFSGVTATVAAGLVLGGSAPIRATAPVRELWEGLWEALGYVANALLFLLIGLAIDPSLLTENIGAIGLAIVVVLLARAIAVVPLMVLIERVGNIPPVGMRNQAVLIWGGLRGGVALALALALPEELAQRDQFVAMTGGVVLATLLLNATTIGMLVRRLGLDEPSPADRFLAGGARLSAITAARERLADLQLEDPIVMSELDQAEEETRAELARLSLDEAAELQLVTRRGLAVERETYQHLSDVGLLPPTATRVLLHEVD
ncbi:MAG TPA: sodium:proton antiporter, partial [Thermomicrobiales bacterium]|nr:sodium:proton antiporter [Thermomicrobiales bacterium]